MKGALNSPEMEGVTPEHVSQLGREWLDFLVNTTPEEKLFSLPKFEHRLVQEYRDGAKEGEKEGKKKGEKEGEKKGGAKMLTRLLQRRFGDLPDWAEKKIAAAEPPALEEWAFRFVDAKSLDEVFFNEA
ncbi:MAG: hypothetical protein HW380_457 [Magnetococcales bacterium]|nr:hypothetical protein [Magnetococcales bacterium]HIJ84595.1 DUF4351 domain-containing protein [Magnetococcales bacterium]